MADRVVKYEGKEFDVTWDGRLCIHVQECGRAHNELFVGGRQPWGQPDAASAGDVTETVPLCPSGAIAFRAHRGGIAERPAVDNSVVVTNRGPLYVRGDLAVEGAAEDMPGVRFRAALCRCGQSKNKPFCDNSHEASGFDDRGAVGEPSPGREASGGPLELNLAPNGPLFLQGNVQIVTAAGRVAWEGTKCALCRCGASKNKPFCDGSHRAAGFDSST